MMQKYKNFLPKIHGTCFIAPGSAVIGNVEIGENSSVWHNAVIRGDVEKIVIGNNSNIQDCCILHCVEDIELRIGDNVTVGHGAILHSCEIGDNTLIGMGAVVLDGAKVGKYCLVGAGTVITPRTEIPDRSLVLGSPGRVKRQLTDEEVNQIKINSDEYVNLASEYKNAEENNK